MKDNKLVPLTFNEILTRQNTVLAPIYAEDEVSVNISTYSEEVIRLTNLANKWQAAFSLTAVLAIWLIAMRFV